MGTWRAISDFPPSIPDTFLPFCALAGISGVSSHPLPPLQLQARHQAPHPRPGKIEREFQHQRPYQSEPTGGTRTG
ncbi:hypothetical protein Naga_102380g1 [Nannochloropsis gaditana]|uniref:Uncharacterized protein n=1 Tax=Nannochloropsis gaditana TaxID=72520 RepID=W7TGD9_9STRA|nr:hypothetical protein Naga_102380g1 [Nannochloropsis gaditana]